MHKAMPAIVGVFALSIATTAFAQMMQSVIVNGFQEQKMCTGTGGVLEYIASNALNKPVGCKCPTGTQFHAPSGGCVTLAAGSRPQANQPVKRMN